MSVRCKTDTGANCCVMLEVVLSHITSQPAQPCTTTLRTFFWSQRSCIKKRTKLPLSHNGQCTEAEFFIVKPEVPVTLSGYDAERLGLISRKSSTDVAGCNEPQGFEDAFRGLGELEGVAHHMQLKPGVQGTVQGVQGKKSCHFPSRPHESRAPKNGK